MTAIPPQLAARLAAEVTTLCHCWRVTRADGARSGYTDHDRALAFDGTEFRPHSGLAASEARETMGAAVDSMDVEGAISSDDLAEDDILAGLYDGAEVETFLVDWRSPEARMLLRRSIIGAIAVEDGRFIAQLESPRLHLDRPNGRWFRRGCDAELGDGRCGVDLDQAAYRGAGLVVAVLANDAVLVTGLDTFDEGWFAHGLLAVDGGGPAHRVLSHRRTPDGARLGLWRTAAPLPQAGAAVTAVAGCDKRFATCKAKFANAPNFQGFPHLPGNDAGYRYASEDQVFDGAPVVP